MGRFARSNSVLVSSLAVQRQPGTARELAAIRINLTARADYVSIKQWLKALLDRYPTLALTSLSLRGANGDAARLEANLVLILFTKN